MSKKLRVGVLISGRGSNLQALIRACEANDYPAKIVVVISNTPDAQGLERARRSDIPCVVVDHREYNNRAAFDAEMTWALEDAKVELVCLAGFMRLLSETFVEHWWDKLINIHPSLLPAFKGLGVQRRAIESGARFSGCTVHYVRHEMDVGPIISQAVVPIHNADDPSALAKRILEQEHRIYPMAVRWIAEDRVRVEGPRVIVSGYGPPERALLNPAPK
jgi:phosphoribosylglycinamide formyltransferase 1